MLYNRMMESVVEELQYLISVLLAIIPQNTSLRKKYIDYVKSGKKSGWGYGAFVYSDANAEV